MPVIMNMVKKRLSTLITICGICSAVVLCILPFTPVLLRLSGTPEDFINVGTKYFIITLFQQYLVSLIMYT